LRSAFPVHWVEGLPNACNGRHHVEQHESAEVPPMLSNPAAALMIGFLAVVLLGSARAMFKR
jgi:hypothetical protein